MSMQFVAGQRLSHQHILPSSDVSRHLQALSHRWQRQERSLERSVETYLLENDAPDCDVTSSSDLQAGLPHGEPEGQVMALSRNKNWTWRQPQKERSWRP